MDATTPTMPATRALGIPGIDLPRIDADTPADPVDDATVARATPATLPVPTAAQLASVDAQGRLRCRDVIDAMGWSGATTLTALLDGDRPLVWLQAAATCGDDRCRHQHTPAPLPGAPSPVPSDRAAAKQPSIATDGVRLKLPGGLQHWVGAERQVLLCAIPELGAVAVLTAAAGFAALLSS